jgi:hypothetical protein
MAAQTRIADRPTPVPGPGSRQAAEAPRPGPGPGPGPGRPRGPVDGPAGPDAVHEPLLLAATIGLLVAAALPLTRVFVGLAFLRPVVGAILLAVGLSAALRRLGAGPVTSLLANVLAWAVFVAMAFLSSSLAFGVLPTLETLALGRDLWLRGIELLRLSPAPAFADAALLLVTVTGIWAVAHAVEGLVFRLHAPIKAIGMALVLFTVPVALAPRSGRVWLWALPLLAAAGVLLLASAGSDLARWGRWAGHSERATRPLSGGGLLTAAAAIALGALLGGLLPGFGQPPWFEMRGAGGTTLTRNPIVTIRSQLVSQSTVPLLRVRTEQPVYLRVTALDTYSETEEWTLAEGIRGVPLNGRALPPDVPVAAAREVTVDVSVAGLTDAILVPIPYQPVTVDGPASRAFQFDRRTATMTLDRGRTLVRDDRYTVTARVPAPPPELLDALATAPVVPNPAVAERFTQLPGNVPPSVAALARDIVAAAGASTHYAQAFAIQEELRTWEYSLDPPQGHSARAMEAFITNRIGYCEQYAGTMAVMLRTLGIPARVAVGFSPGRLVDATAGEYVISQANAHAWVEVLIADVGWVAFEPTPRSDGNVLVPTPGNLAPSVTQDLASQQPAPTIPAPDLPDEDFLPSVPPGVDADAPAPQTGGGMGQGDPGAGLRTALVALLASLAAVGALTAAVRHRRAGTGLAPAERILRARAHVHRIGRGSGVRPAAHETDREYLGRIGTSGAAAGLAAAVERVRYAPDGGDVPLLLAETAERAARDLERELLAGRPAPARALVRVRGPLDAAVEGLLTLLRQPSGRAGRVAGDDGHAGQRMAALVRRRSRVR